MPRPRQCRMVRSCPGTACFGPHGKLAESKDEIILLLDEYEAFRLADYEGLYQEEAASRMQVSRQTFGRIVESARGKVADALVNGKVLRIVGGTVSAKTEGVQCMKIALPARDGRIDAHFGHCAYYTVYTIDDGAIIGEERVESPAGCGCKSNIAPILAGKGVTLLLAGNMGDGAVRVLKGQGIDVVRGCDGAIREVAERWLSGNLTDSGEICHAHDDGHECAHD